VDARFALGPNSELAINAERGPGPRTFGVTIRFAAALIVLRATDEARRQ